MNLLIVDDDRGILNTVERLVHRYEGARRPPRDWRTTTAQGVEEALCAVAAADAKGQPFDRIITDVDMPDGTGFDFILRYSKQSIYAPLIVFMSALVTVERADKAVKFGGILIDKMNLDCIVRTALEGQMPRVATAPASLGRFISDSDYDKLRVLFRAALAFRETCDAHTNGTIDTWIRNNCPTTWPAFRAALLDVELTAIAAALKGDK